jgi:hypothetical protein
MKLLRPARQPVPIRLDPFDLSKDLNHATHFPLFHFFFEIDFVFLYFSNHGKFVTSQ